MKRIKKQSTTQSHPLGSYLVEMYEPESIDDVIELCKMTGVHPSPMVLNIVKMGDTYAFGRCPVSGEEYFVPAKFFPKIKDKRLIVRSISRPDKNKKPRVEEIVEYPIMSDFERCVKQALYVLYGQTKSNTVVVPGNGRHINAVSDKSSNQADSSGTWRFEGILKDVNYVALDGTTMDAFLYSKGSTLIYTAAVDGAEDLAMYAVHRDGDGEDTSPCIGHLLDETLPLPLSVQYQIASILAEYGTTSFGHFAKSCGGAIVESLYDRYEGEAPLRWKGGGNLPSIWCEEYRLTIKNGKIVVADNDDVPAHYTHSRGDAKAVKSAYGK